MVSYADSLISYADPFGQRFHYRALLKFLLCFRAALGFGLFVIAMGFVAQFLGDLVLTIALSIFGFVGGPVLGLLTVGIFFPFVNWKVGPASVYTTLVNCYNQQCNYEGKTAKWL